MISCVSTRLRRRLVAAIALAMISALACAGNSPESRKSAPEPESTGNPTLDQLLGEEMKPDAGGAQPLPASLPYRGSLPFAYTFTAEEGVDRFDMALGDPGNLLSCYVYPKEGELGVTAVRLIGFMAEILEKSVGPFPRRAVQQVVAGVAGSNAYHGVVWLWGDPKGFAQPKAVVGDAAGHAVACVHARVGYRQTLIDTLEHLMTSLESASPIRKPYFEEVQLSEIDGLAIGISRLRMYLDEAGDTEILNETSMMVPTGGDSIAAQYEFKRSWSRPDGSLINAFVYDTDGREMETRLELRPDQERWRVKGRFKGKEMDQLLDHREPIDSTRSEYLWLARRVMPRGDAVGGTVNEWIEDADPTRITPVKFEVDPEDPNRMRVEIGPIRMKAERGPDGFIDRGTTPIGSRSLSTRILYRAGEL